ncbi:MAG: Caffeyl-CoA reductase-Etf complex subunit CarD [Acidimicrobiales bacterium]|nr:MAG: electron transfer flavoprotein subunit beta/FixA family protein [Actinomycetota bacterium]MBV6509888.1 Caffeyl-CoA reductase-Etf complex subunit CarD [Acidimicrobiales bacterium]
MRIVVCVKEVLDPDAVGAYALSGGLVVGEDGKTLTQTTIPRLMNSYDEQAIEAALRIRESGTDCQITVVSVGTEVTAPLRHAMSLGADEIVALTPPDPEPDFHAAAVLLAGYLRSGAGADLVLCGRQASDDDQGVVPALLGEALDMPVVTVARAVEIADSPAGTVVRVTRVTPEGDELVQAPLPAVVTVSSELGEPRYPTMSMRMAARKVQPEVITPDMLSLTGDDLKPRITLVRQFVPTLKGDCELMAGDQPAELAEQLVTRLVEDRLVPGRSS